VRPRPYQPPAFTLRDAKPGRSKALQYFRAEVHLREGGQDYDVMGWRREQLIDDVLDHYQRHLHFLQAMG
jgi:choline/glycine/proline betaine transport protein